MGARKTRNSWELTWSSSAHERYHSSMLDDAERTIEKSGLEAGEVFGGASIGPDEHDPTAADNGYVVIGDELAVHRLAKDLTDTVKHEVLVRKCHA